MIRRQAAQLVAWCLIAAIGCSSDHPAGPGPLPACSSASPVATHVTLAVGVYMAIDPASDSGCAVFAANSSALDSAEYLLVPQSAAGTFGDSSLFQLRGGGLSAAILAAQRLPAPPSPRPAAIQFDGFLRRLGRTRALARAPGPQPAAAALLTPPLAAGPPSVGNLRRFSVCASLTCSKFDTVAARATTVGAHIAIYVDTLAPKAGLDSADLDTLRQVFDTLLYPLDTATFGRVSDIDSNHVVIVLMTGVVNSLVTRTQCESSGFVAGFFFPPDLDTATTSPYNRGEIFYSIVADSASTLSCAHTRAAVKRDLPGTFTHEFQHMINFAQHVLFRPGVNTEEGWLDEGLSKYAEEIAGRSFLPSDTATFSAYAINDVYDAYQYLSATGASPLLIQYDQGTLAEVGASWLFVRYLVDQFGTALPGQLDQTTLVGAANVAAQTGQSFTTLVTRWALTNWVSDLSVPGFTTPPELAYTSWHFRKTFASLNAQDATHFPLPYPLVPTASAGTAMSVTGTLRSGSGVYQRALQGPSAAGFTLFFTPGGAAAFPPAVVARLNVIRIR